MLLAGRRLTATEGEQFGLVNRVVPAAELLNAALALAARVVVNAPLSVAAILDIERRTAAMEPIEAMTSIRSFDSYRAAIDSQDAVEGSASFAEKRPPIWTGR